MTTFTIDTDLGPYFFDTDPCSLKDSDGKVVSMDRFKIAYQPGQHGGTAQAFSPDSPVVGKDQPRVLKIQLGLGCNYACSYCSQGGQKAESTATADAAKFMEDLGTWLHEEPEKIEFWGGEPMLYWRKIEVLAPALRERFPKARFSMVTNGSLLTLERAQWLYALGFSMAVSHDGPGQSLRGDDPFEDPQWVDMIRAVFRLFADRICFNVVITPLNYRLAQTYFWLESRMGFEVKVNVEDVVTDYGGAKWTVEQLQDMAHEIRQAAESGLALAFPRIQWTLQQFMECLGMSKTLDGSHQVCGMDQRSNLAVDLSGNVLTCQNVGANSGHVIGCTSDLDGVTLNTASAWAARPNCRECPVVHLCYGSCMFLQGDEFASSCEASFYYNTALLAGAIFLLTGARVKSISGWRPTRRKPFPIPVVSEAP